MREAFVATAAATRRNGRRGGGARRSCAGGDAGRASPSSRPRRPTEAASLTAELEAAGYPDRSRAHTAAAPRATSRSEPTGTPAPSCCFEGITALETVYRDALAGPGAPTLNLDRPLIVADARAVGAALDACRAARQVLVEHNPNETLLLERLLLHLPAAS